MTRLEFDTFAEATCPCGAGQVLRHVASTDYRHDRPRITYSLGCAHCSAQWRLDHGTLVERASELPYFAAKARADEAQRRLTALAQEVTRNYLAEMTFQSKKAELEYLTANGLTTARYASYLKDRGAGQHMHELAYGPRNPAWLLLAGSAVGAQDQLAVLLVECEQTSRAAAVTATQVVRRALR